MNKYQEAWERHAFYLTSETVPEGYKPIDAVNDENTIRLALRIAQAVTEEPSEEMEDMGRDKLVESWPFLQERLLYNRMPPEPLVDAFRAMIEQMMLEVQDER